MHAALARDEGVGKMPSMKLPTYAFRILAFALAVGLSMAFLHLIAAPAEGIPNPCGPSVYQSGTMSLQTTFSIFYLKVEMVSVGTWNGRICTNVQHYMRMYSVSPVHWTMNVGTGDGVSRLKIQLPSWSLIDTPGTWNPVCCPYVDVTRVGGGAGYNYVEWEGVIYWPGPSGYTWLDLLLTRKWTSGFGQSYPVTFTLKDMIPGGVERSGTLYMKS